ncbi:hypothetical protein ACWC09_18025, partial [Streptomyces sp. NPDC001617]
GGSEGSRRGRGVSGSMSGARSMSVSVSVSGPSTGRPPGRPPRRASSCRPEIAAHESFNYALLDPEETAIFGCVYIDPPERTGADAEISWWVVDELVDTETEHAVDTLVPHWITTDWPFRHPRHLGRDITWQDWLALPPTS